MSSCGLPAARHTPSLGPFTLLTCLAVLFHAAHIVWSIAWKSSRALTPAFGDHRECTGSFPLPFFHKSWSGQSEEKELSCNLKSTGAFPLLSFLFWYRRLFVVNKETHREERERESATLHCAEPRAATRLWPRWPVPGSAAASGGCLSQHQPSNPSYHSPTHSPTHS